jgi:uncharacterized protein
MKLQLETGGQNLFTGYGPGYVSVNGVRRNTHSLVSAAQIKDWDIADFEALSPRHFASLIADRPEIVVFGTGSTQRFPHPSLSQLLYSAGIGLEIMDTKAACRTYNILCSEGRKVLAAILIE